MSLRNGCLLVLILSMALLTLSSVTLATKLGWLGGRADWMIRSESRKVPPYCEREERKVAGVSEGSSA